MTLAFFEIFPRLFNNSGGVALLVILAYLGLLLLLGIFANRLFAGTSKDYMLANRSIGPFLLLMSIFGTTMTAFALVGSTGEAYTQGVGVYGMLASSSGIIHSLCFFLLGIRLWSWGAKNGYTTQIQFFRDRLQTDGIGVLLFPILVGLVIPYLLIGVMAGGVVINSITEGFFPADWTFFASGDYGVPKWAGSLLVCGVVLIYVFFGGMRGTAWANAFQTMVFMVLGIITFSVIASELGGPAAASEKVREKHPSKLVRELEEQDKQDYERQFAAWKRMAEYNFLKKYRDLSLSTDEAAQAKQEFKPRMPGWPMRAETQFAFTNYTDRFEALTDEEKQVAYILQDDRVLPEGVLGDDGAIAKDAGDKLVGSAEDPRLEEYPRSEDWELGVLAAADKAGRLVHPDQAAEDKFTRKVTLGRHRAANWAPEEPKPIEPWVFFTYMLIPLSVGMFPHLFQHWLTAKDADSFKLPVIAHPIFIAIVWVPCVLVGVWATSANAPGSETAPLIPPHFPANAVLARMVSVLTGDWLGVPGLLAGLLTAGVLAAIMSSLDSQFLCLGTMFTEDIVVHYGGKDRFDETQQVWIARGFIILIVAVTYWLSLYEPRRVFQLGVWCFSGFSSLFPVVFAAVYWRRLTAAGAYAGVLAAFATWATLFYMSDFALRDGFHPGGVMPVVWMFLASAVATVGVSWITSPPEKETLAKFYPDIAEELGHTPADAGEPVSKEYAAT